MINSITVEFGHLREYSQPFMSSPFHFLDLSLFMSNFDTPVFEKQFLNSYCAHDRPQCAGPFDAKSSLSPFLVAHILINIIVIFIILIIIVIADFVWLFSNSLQMFLMTLHFHYATPHTSNKCWRISMWKTFRAHENWITLRTSSLVQFPLLLPLQINLCSEWRLTHAPSVARFSF